MPRIRLFDLNENGERIMRQWMVDPQLLCTKHLGGEHVEHHMFIGSLIKNIDVTGYITKGLLELGTLRRRHQELATEMLNRGGKHKSPIPEAFDEEKYKQKFAHLTPCINIEDNLRELHRRCPNCRARIQASVAAGRTPDLWHTVPNEV